LMPYCSTWIFCRGVGTDGAVTCTVSSTPILDSLLAEDRP
jgi:hypothetical protein